MTNHSGKFLRLDQDGEIDLDSDADSNDAVISWVCRRVADFDVPIPEGARFADCFACGMRIAYNPDRRVNAPKICMQCAGLEPLPIGEAQ